MCKALQKHLLFICLLHCKQRLRTTALLQLPANAPPLFLYPVVDFVLHRLVSTTRCWTRAPTIPLNAWQSIAMRDSTGRAPIFHFACVRRGFNPHWWFCWNFVSDCSTSLLFWGSDSADRQSDKPKFQRLPSPRKTITFQKAWITALTLRPAIYNASRIL